MKKKISKSKLEVKDLTALLERIILNSFLGLFICILT